MKPLLPLLVALAACADPALPQRPPATPVEARAGWSAIRPAIEAVLVTLPAATVPSPAGRAALAPPVSGRLEAWSVRPGDAVVAGDVLAALTSPEHAARLAAVERGRALVAAVGAQVDLGVATQRDLAEARASLAHEEASLQAAGRDLRAQGGQLAWVAPRAGRVQALACERGAPVDPSVACVVLVDAGSTWVEVALPDRYDGRVTDARLDFHPASGAPAVRLGPAGEAPAYDPVSRTRALWFTDPATDLPHGLGGRGDLVVPAPADAVEVPAAALTRVEGTDVVFVRRLLPGPVPVEVLGRAPDGVVVRAAGLAADDEVAVRGLLLLKAAAAPAEGGEE